jgi:hypothetical protein
MNPQLTPPNGRRELRLPRWAVPIVWAILVLVILVVLPWAVSKLGPRYGWSQAVPATWNLTGLIAVTAGLVMYVWCLVFHFKSYRDSVRVGFSPPHLVVTGIQGLSEPDVRCRTVRLDRMDGLLWKPGGFHRANTPVVVIHF